MVRVSVTFHGNVQEHDFDLDRIEEPGELWELISEAVIPTVDPSRVQVYPNRAPKFMDPTLITYEELREGAPLCASILASGWETWMDEAELPNEARDLINVMATKQLGSGRLWTASYQFAPLVQYLCQVDYASRKTFQLHGILSQLTGANAPNAAMEVFQDQNLNRQIQACMEVKLPWRQHAFEWRRRAINDQERRGMNQLLQTIEKLALRPSEDSWTHTWEGHQLFSDFVSKVDEFIVRMPTRGCSSCTSTSHYDAKVVREITSFCVQCLNEQPTQTPKDFHHKFLDEF